jgi:hypothetical protein
MYRKRRKKLQRRRRATVALVAGFVLAFTVAVPAMANANAVNDLLHNLGLGDGSGSAGTAGGGTATPDAGTPPSYTPPLHGTDPHGQGTDAVVDLTPSSNTPLSGDPSQGDEEVIAGDSRGSQDSSGNYHGSVTLASLLGTPIIQVTTNPGETKDGPLQPLQDGLDNLCSSSSGQLCLTVLGMHSSTTSSGSSNSFTGANVSIGGANGINADALSSSGDISDDGSCQTAHGHSRVAGAGLGAPAGDTLNVAEGDSSSKACNDGTQSVNQSSSVINLAGNGIPVPATGCDNGTANTNFVALAPLLATVCNADDTNGSQTSSPYGVREALTAFVLALNGSALVKATTAGPESHAVAPGGGPTNPPTNPGNNKGGNKGAGGKGGNNGGNGGGGNGGGAGNGSAAGSAGTGNGALAFTGADLLALALVGGALILGGLALTTTAGRRHRQTI